MERLEQLFTVVGISDLLNDLVTPSMISCKESWPLPVTWKESWNPQWPPVRSWPPSVTCCKDSWLLSVTCCKENCPPKWPTRSVDPSPKWPPTGPVDWTLLPKWLPGRINPIQSVGPGGSRYTRPLHSCQLPDRPGRKVFCLLWLKRLESDSLWEKCRTRNKHLYYW